MGFKWQGGVTIDGSESYNDLEITMDTMSLDLSKEQGNTHLMDNHAFIGICLLHQQL